jgi:hypothetical protein
MAIRGGGSAPLLAAEAQLVHCQRRSARFCENHVCQEEEATNF